MNVTTSAYSESACPLVDPMPCPPSSSTRSSTTFFGLAARIRAACVEMTPPPAEDMWTHVYNEPHALVDEERDAYLAYLDSFADAEEHA